VSVRIGRALGQYGLAATFSPRSYFGKLTATATRESAARFMATCYRQTSGRGVRRPVTVCRVTVPSNYAATLVGLRQRFGFSQQQLSAQVGAASKAVVYQWESGKRKPSPVFWLRIERLNRQRPPALDSKTNLRRS
jgi:ribosome-binding protein aMBF1 (putative translation factor)